MLRRLSERMKKWLVVPPLIAGIVVFVFLVQTRQGPQRTDLQEEACTVRVIDVTKAAVAPRALGYGMAQPGKVWQAVAEVKGKIVALHPQLKRGAIIPAGTVLMRIDPTAYTLTIAQMEANIQEAKAQLAELDVKAANTQASLDIEEHSLNLAEKERQRIQNLSKRDIAACSQLDQEQRAVLTQRNAVQTLRNTLNLIPAERQALQAKLALYQAQLASAKLDLDHTTITAPFPCRIAQVNVEITQFGVAPL